MQQTYFETPFFGEPHAQIWGLALRGGLDPITVPTLGPWGGGLLVLLLVSAALFTLVRRES